MIEHLSKEFWSQRYRDGKTGWDLGEASRPLVAYFDQLEDKSIRILIPGCGNAYEAEYLHRIGFKNVYIIDLSKEPLAEFKKRNPDFPEEHIICDDIFLHKGKYDLIIEQTLFCAIDPVLRDDYIAKISTLLNPRGKYVGVLFDREFEGGPPYGGDKAEYESYLKNYFQEYSLEPCKNSVEPRLGSELFMIARV